MSGGAKLGNNPLLTASCIPLLRPNVRVLQFQALVVNVLNNDLILKDLSVPSSDATSCVSPSYSTILLWALHSVFTFLITSTNGQPGQSIELARGEEYIQLKLKVAVLDACYLVELYGHLAH
jgi:hypothetical protein